MDPLFFVTSFLALFAIVNPFSTASVFMLITPGKTVEERIQMARTSVVVSGIILIVFALVGQYILDFFSISIEALKIAAGLIVARIGFKMLNTGRDYFKSFEEKEHAIDRV